MGVRDPRSRGSWWTRRIACPSGDTTSARTTAGSPGQPVRAAAPTAWRAGRRSPPSPRRPRPRFATTSWTCSGLEQRARLRRGFRSSEHPAARAAGVRRRGQAARLLHLTGVDARAGLRLDADGAPSRRRAGWTRRPGRCGGVPRRPRRARAHAGPGSVRVGRAARRVRDQRVRDGHRPAGHRSGRARRDSRDRSRRTTRRSGVRDGMAGPLSRRCCGTTQT